MSKDEVNQQNEGEKRFHRKISSALFISFKVAYGEASDV